MIENKQNSILLNKEFKQQQQKSYVSALVDVTVQVIACIWPTSMGTNTKPIADLNTFLHHILKHSRTTHSTLQLAIFYLFRIRSTIQQRKNEDVYASCGRRMFLAALISAHKYLQDKTYKNSAWSKVSGLPVQEINHAEKVLLELLDYRLYVDKHTYDQWMTMLQTHLKINPLHINHYFIVPAKKQPSPVYGDKLMAAQQSLPSPPLEEIHMKRKAYDEYERTNLKKPCYPSVP